MVRHIDAALDALAEAPSDPSLFMGFTGVAWALEHLHALLPDFDDALARSSGVGGPSLAGLAGSVLVAALPPSAVLPDADGLAHEESPTARVKAAT
jgi:hypothetical protein